MQRPSRTLETPAKVNLSLAVGARRADGYHSLTSVLVPVAVTDRLTVTLTDAPGDVAVRCDTPGVPTDSKNLVVRAVAAFREATGWSAGVEITLTKRIPVAAGLGGGSSDAAATLIALADLSETALSDAEFVDLAAQIGSDVPFFVHVHRHGGPARISGIGEHVEPVDDLPHWTYVLVHPGFAVSTQWVYEAYDVLLTKPGGGSTVRAFALGEVEVYNQLEAATFARFPGLVAFRDALLHEDALAALLAGSGATVCGVFADRRRAAKACETLCRRDWTNIVMGADEENSAPVSQDVFWWAVAEAYSPPA